MKKLIEYISWGSIFIGGLSTALAINILISQMSSGHGQDPMVSTLGMVFFAMYFCGFILQGIGWSLLDRIHKDVKEV